MSRLEFVVHGPFIIQTNRTRSGPELLLDTFWNGDTLATLRRLCGCYVFAVRRVKGELVPEYVGLTRGRFDTEVFNRSNLLKYRKAMRDAGGGHPVLFLIVPPHGKGKVSRRFIGDLEDFLIQAGSARNPRFRNVKGVRKQKWVIKGVTGRRAGKPPVSARRGSPVETPRSAHRRPWRVVKIEFVEPLQGRGHNREHKQPTARPLTLTRRG